MVVTSLCFMSGLTASASWPSTTITRCRFFAGLGQLPGQLEHEACLPMTNQRSLNRERRGAAEVPGFFHATRQFLPLEAIS